MSKYKKILKHNKDRKDMNEEIKKELKVKKKI